MTPARAEIVAAAFVLLACGRTETFPSVPILADAGGTRADGSFGQDGGPRPEFDAGPRPPCDPPRALGDVGQRPVPSGNGARDVSVDPETGVLYVALGGGLACGITLAGDSRLAVVDPATGLVSIVESGEAPVATVVDTARDAVYVASSGSGLVLVHARGSGRLLDGVPVGGAPSDLALDSSLGVLVVSNTNPGANGETFVSLVDTARRTVRADLRVASDPAEVVADEGTDRAYVVHRDGSTVSTVDVARASIRDDLSGLRAPSRGAALHARTRRLLVGSAGGDPNAVVTALNVDAGRIDGTIASFSPPDATPTNALAVDEARGLLFAAVDGASVVGVADLETLCPLGTFAVLGCPVAIALDPDRGLGFTASFNTDRLTSFSLDSVARALGR